MAKHCILKDITSGKRSFSCLYRKCNDSEQRIEETQFCSYIKNMIEFSFFNFDFYFQADPTKFRFNYFEKLKK